MTNLDFAKSYTRPVVCTLFDIDNTMFQTKMQASPSEEREEAVRYSQFKQVFSPTLYNFLEPRINGRNDLYAEHCLEIKTAVNASGGDAIFGILTCKHSVDNLVWHAAEELSPFLPLYRANRDGNHEIVSLNSYDLAYESPLIDNELNKIFPKFTAQSITLKRIKKGELILQDFKDERFISTPQLLKLGVRFTVPPEAFFSEAGQSTIDPRKLMESSQFRNELEAWKENRIKLISKQKDDINKGRLHICDLNGQLVLLTRDLCERRLYLPLPNKLKLAEVKYGEPVRYVDKKELRSYLMVVGETGVDKLKNLKQACLGYKTTLAQRLLDYHEVSSDPEKANPILTEINRIQNALAITKKELSNLTSRRPGIQKAIKMRSIQYERGIPAPRMILVDDTLAVDKVIKKAGYSSVKVKQLGELLEEAGLLEACTPVLFLALGFITLEQIEFLIEDPNHLRAFQEAKAANNFDRIIQLANLVNPDSVFQQGIVDKNSFIKAVTKNPAFLSKFMQLNMISYEETRILLDGEAQRVLGQTKALVTAMLTPQNCYANLKAFILQEANRIRQKGWSIFGSRQKADAIICAVLGFETDLNLINCNDPKRYETAVQVLTAVLLNKQFSATEAHKAAASALVAELKKPRLFKFGETKSFLRTRAFAMPFYQNISFAKQFGGIENSLEQKNN